MLTKLALASIVLAFGVPAVMSLAGQAGLRLGAGGSPTPDAYPMRTPTAYGRYVARRPSGIPV